MSITHKKRSVRADDPDPSDIQPSDWNDDHDVAGVVGQLLAVTQVPDAFPYIKMDGTGAMTLLSAPARAALAASTRPLILASLGAAGLDSPAFINLPTAPTAALGTNTNQIATMAAIKAARDDLVNAAPGVLDTLGELAAALGGDASFSVTVSAALGNRLRFDSAQSLSAPQKAQAVVNLGLAAVAVSGNYTDLAGKPTLTTVAATGAYSDLTGKPTLGTAAALDVGTAALKVVQLDASAKLPAVDGSQLTNVNASGSLSFASSQSLTPAQRLQAYVNLGMPFQCGRLTRTSATALKFAPLNGDLLKINGAIVRIPAAGISGLANASVFVNGTAASNLAASTLYYVYAFVNSGVVTADFSTTTHATSTTAGNEGVEVKSGDDTRALIGLLYTNVSSQFVDIQLLSWFNRRGKIGSLNANTTGTSATIDFVTWPDEAVTLDHAGWLSNSTAAYNNAHLVVDGSDVTQNTTADTNPTYGILRVNMSMSASAIFAEGRHYAGITVDNGGGTSSLSATLKVTVRG